MKHKFMQWIIKTRLSYWILSSIGVLSIVMGLAFIFLRPLVVLLPEDTRYTGLSPEQLKALNPHLFSWIGMVFRSWGAFAIGYGIMIVGLASNAFRQGDRWAWKTLSSAGLITLFIFFLVNLYIGSNFLWVIGTVMVAFIAALWLGWNKR